MKIFLGGLPRQLVAAIIPCFQKQRRERVPRTDAMDKLSSLCIFYVVSVSFRGHIEIG
jgi:hypothetical protein